MRRWLAVASWGCGALVSFAGSRLAVRRSRGISVLLAGLALASCRRTSSDPSGAGGAAGAANSVAAVTDSGDGVLSAESSVPTARTVETGALAASTRRACRVMSLRGDATSSIPVPRSARAGEETVADASATRFLVEGQLLPEGAIIDLGTGGVLTVQATVSTREMTLVGPAIAEACPGGDEAIRLSRGKATSFPGAGVRPGAEVWVATPLGVVRFNEAKIEIEVLGAEAEHLKVVVVTGQATFVPAAGVTMDPATAPIVEAGANAAPLAPLALTPGTTMEASRPKATPARWTRDLIAACTRRAGAAREAGQKVAAGSRTNRASLADLAAAHVQARQLARAACESARAAGALPLGPLDGALRADLVRAEEAWKAVPPAPSSAPAASQ
jgi:hypothetical protein